MNLNQDEIEQFTKLIEDLNSKKMPADQKVLVTPGVVTAMILTTLSGLCLTSEQEKAVKKLMNDVGDLPINISINDLMKARADALKSI